MWKRKEVIGDCTLYLGDCLEVMPTLGPVDAVATDPPYGVGFAEWDRAIPDWFPVARNLSGRIVLTTAPTTVWDYPRPDWQAAWVCPGRTARTAQGGFNHWTPVLVYGARFRVDMAYLPPTANLACREYPPGFAHPSPKPIEVMRWLVRESSAQTETVLDPFMGSGTTGVACVKLGRKFIGIELDEAYFDIACKRIREAYAQPDMFVPAPEKPVQEAMF